MLNKPIKFKPILKEKIWGGDKLITVLNKKSVKKNIGESWEISNNEHDTSIAVTQEFQGQTLTALIKTYKDELVGKKVYDTFGDKFPLLIKFIDAKEALSIQLHPNDEIAKKKHNSFGKTEMWYVIQADTEANLIVGFNKKINATTYQKHLKNNTLLEILNTDKVQKGDVYFIPTGRVHAIGAGVLLAEIQQTSDITYRIYDWERKDKQGNYRELHTKDALKALDFNALDNYKTNYNVRLNQSQQILNCPYFTTNILIINGFIDINHTNKDSFIIYMCVAGNVIFANNDFEVILTFGETILIPNSVNEFTISASIKSELLEVYIE